MAAVGKVILAGGSGLIGSILAERLASDGSEVVILTRFAPAGSASDGSVRHAVWDGVEQGRWSDEVNGASCVVNLSGAPVMRRWTARAKRLMRSSRIESTAAIRTAIMTSAKPPPVWVNASAVGFYGDRGDEILTEASGPGRGFFPQLCRDWEAEAAELDCPNVSLICLRLGMVLSRRGGALPAMQRLARLGLCGTLAGGQMWVPWIHEADLAELVTFLIEAASAGRGDGEGLHCVNAVSPNPIRSRELTDFMGTHSGRRIQLPLPKLAVEPLGWLGFPTALLDSGRVGPAAAEGAGFQFRFPNFAQAAADLQG